jgi:hypothetical protein
MHELVQARHTKRPTAVYKSRKVSELVIYGGVVNKGRLGRSSLFMSITALEAKVGQNMYSLRGETRLTRGMLLLGMASASVYE